MRDLSIWFIRDAGFATDDDIGRILVLDERKVGIVTDVVYQEDGTVRVSGQIQNPNASSEEEMYGILSRLEITDG